MAADERPPPRWALLLCLLAASTLLAPSSQAADQPPPANGYRPASKEARRPALARAPRASEAPRARAALSIRKVIAGQAGLLVVLSRPVAPGREIVVALDGSPMSTVALSPETLSVDLPPELATRPAMKIQVREGKVTSAPYLYQQSPAAAPARAASGATSAARPGTGPTVAGALWKGQELQIALSRPAAAPTRVAIEGVPIDPSRITATAPDRFQVRLDEADLGDNDRVTLTVDTEGYQLAKVIAVPRPGPRRLLLLALLGGLAALALAAAAWISRQRLQRAGARTAQTAEGVVLAGIARNGAAPPPQPEETLWRATPVQAAAAVSVPPAPAELIEALRAERCLLFAGGGISAGAGLPTFRPVLAHLIDQLDPSSPQTEVARQALQAGRLELVSDLIGTLFAPDQLHRKLSDLMARARPTPTPLVQALARLPFAGIITTSYDTLLDEAFQQRKPIVLSPTLLDGMEATVRPGSFPLVKLNGALSGPGDLVLGDAQTRSMLAEHSYLARYLGTKALGNSLLFVGVGLETIELFFSALNLSAGPHPHFALVPRAEDIDVYAEVLRAKFGVQLIVVEPTAGMTAVQAFVESLARGSTTASAGAVGRPDIQPFHIHQIKLQNIGPFAELTLDLRSSWTVLIGNNGCGKSTILKAIALGLCGDDEQAAQIGRRLLNARARSGVIELQIEGMRYRTELHRQGDRVRVGCKQLTPLQYGRWVALGFPPIRGVSMNAPRGPGAEGAATPVVSDLLPLLTGTVDTRIDNLKQWIINLYVRSREGRDRAAAEATPSGRLLAAFFEMLKELTPGAPFRFDKVDPVTWEVLVETTDGVVPIELLSQGMSSILGWAGALLQRIYEIHTEVDHPEQQPALLLLDEMDAHLHPLWQQKLMPILRGRFPGLQVVATTHSPLVVAGLSKEELYTLRREGQTILVEEAPWNLKGWRVDQILTSPTFQLEGARDLDTVNTLSRYTELASKLQPSDKEKAELTRLAAEIQVSLPQPESQPQARVASQMIEETMRARLEQMPEERRQKVVQEIRVQVQEAITGSRRPS